MSQAAADGWYFAQQNQQYGPLGLNDLQQRVAAGQVAGSDMVWCDGMTNWQTVSSLPHLFGEVAPTLGYAAPAGVGYLGYQSQQHRPQYVGFWWRVLAYIIDYLILLVPNLVINAMTQGIAASASRGDEMLVIGVALGGSAVQIVISWLYFSLSESGVWQASLGKKACGFIVTDLNGNRLSFGRATGRYFGKILSGLILCIGFIMVGFMDRKQGLHDIMAGTVVVKK